MIRRVRVEAGGPVELRASVWISAAEASMLSLAVAALAATFQASAAEQSEAERAKWGDVACIAREARELRARLDDTAAALVRAELGELPAPTAGLVRELLGSSVFGGEGGSSDGKP